MPEDAHTYRISEVVGTSPTGIQQAIENGIARAGEAMGKLDWFEMRQIRGSIGDDGVAWYQVTLGVGSRIE